MNPAPILRIRVHSSPIPAWAAAVTALLFLATASSAEFQLEQDLNGTAVGESFVGAYRVTDTGGQPCLGKSASGPFSVEHGLWPTLGSPPIAQALSFTIAPGETLELSLPMILAAATDADGDRIRVDSVSPLSSRGGAVLLGTNAVVYTGRTGFIGLDRFTYSLIDSGGDVASGSVLLTIGPPVQIPPAVVHGPFVTNGVFLVCYEGIPGLTYTIECSERLVPGSWRKHLNVTASSDPGNPGIGVFEVREMITASSSRFFRAVYPAY